MSLEGGRVSAYKRACSSCTYIRRQYQYHHRSINQSSLLSSIIDRIIISLELDGSMITSIELGGFHICVLYERTTTGRVRRRRRCRCHRLSSSFFLFPSI